MWRKFEITNLEWIDFYRAGNVKSQTTKSTKLKIRSFCLDETKFQGVFYNSSFAHLLLNNIFDIRRNEEKFTVYTLAYDFV